MEKPNLLIQYVERNGPAAARKEPAVRTGKFRKLLERYGPQEPEKELRIRDLR